MGVGTKWEWEVDRAGVGAPVLKAPKQNRQIENPFPSLLNDVAIWQG